MPTKDQLHKMILSDMSSGTNKQDLKYGTEPHPRFDDRTCAWSDCKIHVSREDIFCFFHRNRKMR